MFYWKKDGAGFMIYEQGNLLPPLISQLFENDVLVFDHTRSKYFVLNGFLNAQPDILTPVIELPFESRSLWRKGPQGYWLIVDGCSISPTTSLFSGRNLLVTDTAKNKQYVFANYSREASNVFHSATDATAGYEMWSYFYHMTHYRNLAGIFQEGILSWTVAHSRGLTQTDISDPSVQRRRNRLDPVYNRSIHDYAPLYINPKNAMLYVKRKLQHELIILKVSADVLCQHQYVISDGNAASRTTQFSVDRQITAASDVALRATYWNEVPDGKRRRSAEVLVYPIVEARFIVAAICNNQDVINTIRDVCPVPIVIDKTMYY